MGKEEFSLKHFISQALWLYHNQHKNVTTQEILRMLEEIRFELTEEFVKQHGSAHTFNLYDRTQKIAKPARKRNPDV